MWVNISWICLIMPEYAEIYLNGFCFTFTHCNPLSIGTIDCFLGKQKFDFFYSTWKHLILFLDWMFLQERFKICCYLWGPKGPGDLNLSEPVRYPINTSMMLFYDLSIYFAVAAFSLFGTSKVLIGDSVLWSVNVRERKPRYKKKDPQRL